MKLEQVINNNNELQSEASKFLKVLELVEALSKFGRIDLGGSYVYGTMVDRDIDIAVLTKNLNIKNRSEVLSMVSNIPNVSKISMVDYVNSPSKNKGAIIWIGLTVKFKENNWNIDITLADPDSPNVHTNIELHKKMLKISEEDRLEILKLKNKALIKGKKKKGQTSSEIYKRVLKLDK